MVARQRSGVVNAAKRKSSRGSATNHRLAQTPVADREFETVPKATQPPSRLKFNSKTQVAWLAILVGTFFWSYWPVLQELVTAWNREPDYSHGYFVLPVAAYFLWTRRQTFPGFTTMLAWIGLAIIAVASSVRIAASLWYLTPVEAWTMPLWLAGFCGLLGGWKLIRWSMPGLLFLGFMIPLPYRAESMLSYPLQRAATHLSCWLLQFFGQAAFSEGNVIIVNDMELLIAEACSGVRIFVSIIAIAFAYAVLIRRPWWFKAAVFAAVLPVTLIANALRIAITGVLLTHVSGEAAHRFSHDMAGFAMIPLAAAIFALVIWYLGRLIVETESVLTSELLVSDP
jgi:exosortase